MALDALKPLRPKNEEDKKRDKKFHAFVRHDLDKVDYFWALLTSPRQIPNFIFSWSPWFLSWFVFKISMLFKKDDKPFSGKVKQFLFKVQQIVPYVTFWLNNCTFMPEQKKVDYTEYLGPDWECSFEGHGTVISNHQSWMDILVHMYVRIPSHVAKEGTKKLPFVGTVATGCSSLYVERENKEQKRTLITQIEERQKACERGEYPPLIIYPEGGTTNGKYIIKFKKGAFASLTSILPVVIKYECEGMHTEGSQIPIWSNIGICGLCIKCMISYTEFPVFRPNEYFFKHHQQEGEEKWETYARVIREIMSKHSGLQLSELSIEDKYTYKDLIYGKSGKQKKSSD